MKKLKAWAKLLKMKTAQVFVALHSKQTPFLAKIFAALTILYALSPIDLIPDFIPILGLLDDVIIIPILILISVSLIPKPLWNSFEEEASMIWTNGTPKKWVYAIPVLILWTGLAAWLIYTLIRLL